MCQWHLCKLHENNLCGKKGIITVGKTDEDILDLGLKMSSVFRVRDDVFSYRSENA